MSQTGRAYATFEVKSYDAEQGIIEGLASSPEPDRVGDVLESQGAKFKLPMPLLWQHRADEPIGQVVAATVTKAGIQIRARIATELLPRIDRIREAWDLIKSGLVRGLSVGFRAVDGEPIKGTYGVRFKEWEWVETSAVTIPANASASIAAIKSFDTSAPPAPGAAGGVPSIPAGAAASPRKQTMVSQELTGKLAELRAKRTRLEELRTKAADTAPSEQELTERQTLTTEIKALNTDIDELRAIEGAIGADAVRVPQKQAPGEKDFKRFEGASEVKLPPGIGFARYVIAKMAAALNNVSALEIAKARWPEHSALHLLVKTAVAPMGTDEGAGVGGTALVYAQNLVAEFVEWLRPQTIIGQFGTGGIPSLRRVPFNVRIGGQTSAGAGYWVGEKVQKPLTRFNTTASTLAWNKVASIAVISDELARFSAPSAEALVRDELGRALVERLDIDFVDPMVAAVAGVHPASITNTVVALTPSGTDAAAVRADIQQLLNPFITANINVSSGVFIMPNTVALTLSLMRNALGNREFPNITMMGGSLEGFPVIASQYAVSGSPLSNLLIFVAANEIFLADDGGVTIDASREASLEMSDDPAGEVGTVTSMFQTNSIALRAERYITWAKRQPAACQYLDNVAYNSGSPTP